jgi:hypothetical protein
MSPWTVFVSTPDGSAKARYMRPVLIRSTHATRLLPHRLHWLFE